MRLSSIFLAAAAVLPVFGAAVPSDEASLEARGWGTWGAGLQIVKSVNKITKAVAGLDKAIVNVKTGADSEIAAVLDALAVQQATLVNETAVVKKAGKIDEHCVDYVQYFVEKLIKTIDKLATDLIAIKPKLAIGGYDTLVPSILQGQQELANAFADVLITKVPKSALATAQNDKKQVNAAFERIYAVYGQPS